jgi:hypothetical protein
LAPFLSIANFITHYVKRSPMPELLCLAPLGNIDQ